jgi:hypothetical protein
MDYLINYPSYTGMKSKIVGLHPHCLYRQAGQGCAPTMGCDDITKLSTRPVPVYSKPYVVFQRNRTISPEFLHVRILDQFQFSNAGMFSKSEYGDYRFDLYLDMARSTLKSNQSSRSSLHHRDRSKPSMTVVSVHGNHWSRPKKEFIVESGFWLLENNSKCASIS